MDKIKKLKEISKNAHKFMEASVLEDANTRWINKNSFNELVLIDGTSLDNLIYKDDLEINISKELFQTNNSSIKFLANTLITKSGPRPTKGFTIKLDNKDLSNYNRIVFDVYIKSTGYQNFYFHFGLLNDNKWVHCAPSLTPNKWNKVVWEIGSLDRCKVNGIQITCFMMGTPPEALSEISVYVDKVYTDVVVLDYDYGWDVEDRIAYSHIGYLSNARKTALTQIEALTFKVLNKNNEVVLEKKTSKIINSLGKFTLLDFSEITKIGEYIIEVGNVKTKEISINNNIYDSSIWKSMNFLRLLRCGEFIENVHSECHLNSRTYLSDGRSVPNFGGWHDAGDVSQFEICTAEMAHAILDLADSVKNKDIDLYERLLEEAKVGINWLLKTRFKDGNRALAILYSVWRDNVLNPSDDYVKLNIGENGPFENLLASSALAKASIMFKELDENYSAWCLRAAIEDLEFGIDGYKKGIHTKRWGKNIDSCVCGTILLACSEIYLNNKEQKYLDKCLEFLDILDKTQEKDGISDQKIRGFFYEDVLHQYLLTFEHRGHEQSPIHGLTKFYEITQNKKALDIIMLYQEYILKTKDFAYPYNLMPSQIYLLDKLNMERFTVPASYGTTEEAHKMLQEQIKHGIKLDDNSFVRIFPVSIQRRGFHATLLSKTKAISSIYKVLKTKELKQIILDQIEWIFGKNPFSSSTMYGEGYNYHPLYVAFSPQMVGALPVGIETKGELDLPYWPVATQAVYKEIWGHTTGKYLWVLADIM